MSHGTVLVAWEKEGGRVQALVTSTLDAALHEQPALSGFLRLSDGTFARTHWRESPQAYDDPFYWGFPSYLVRRVIALGVENVQRWNKH